MKEPNHKFIPAPTYSIERYVPYRVLWMKVIIRAAHDYALWRESDDVRLRKFALDAAKWLFDESALDNSFMNICVLCGLPSEQLREWARSLNRDQVKKFEYLERQGRDPLTLALKDKSSDEPDGPPR